MTQKIPESLVTIAQVPSPSQISGEEKIDRTTIKGFWQAFFVSRQASNKEMDRRLEYLFWRIWSSDDLLDRTNTKYLDGLVSRIMAAEPLPSPSQGEQHQFRLASATSSMATSPRAVPNSDSQKPTQSKSVPPNGTPGSLHSILKKPNTAPTPTHKTTRLLLEHPGGGSGTRVPSNPPPPSVIEITPKDDFATGKQIQPHIHPPPAKKATHFTTGRAARGGKRRPVFNRRKSSQISIPKAPASPKDRPVETSRPVDIAPRDSPEPMFDVDEDDDLSAPLDPQTVAAAKSAATSWASVNIPAMTATAPIIPTKKQTQTPPQLTPTTINIKEKQDPILSQGIETFI